MSTPIDNNRQVDHPSEPLINISFKNSIYQKIAGIWSLFTTPSAATITNRNIQVVDLKAISLKSFHRFKEVWNFEDFWKRANTCDACILFVSALNDRFPNDPEVNNINMALYEILLKNLTYFKNYDLSDKWADDLGWWGLMGISAHNFLQKKNTPIIANEFLSLSETCWEKMYSHAYDKGINAKPVPNGCRNGELDGKQLGVKNTVVNALFLMLSIKLYHLTNQDKYLESAYQQWVWFSSWFHLEYQYLKAINEESGLVQERPTAFFEGSDYQDTTHPTWKKDSLWSGDQGLILGSFIELLSLKDHFKQIDPINFEKELRGVILTIGKGVQKALTDTQGLIREAPFSSNFGAEFGVDYLGGRGVLIRFLNLNQLKGLGVDLYSNLEATINALWSARNEKTNQFKPEYTTEDQDTLYNDQFAAIWGCSDQVSRWGLSADEITIHGVCQAMGLDFLGAALARGGSSPPIKN